MNNVNNVPYRIFINKQSGTIKEMGQEAFIRALENCGIEVKTIQFLDALELINEIKEVREGPPILIGGGDGTIKSCASLLMKKEIPFGILPLGTMNLLAKDLNIPIDIERALSAYAKGFDTDIIDVGYVNDEIFLCCAGIGAIPDASDYRETLRDSMLPILISRLTTYTFQQMDQNKHRKMTLIMDGVKVKKIKTAALAISNNRYGPQGQWNIENFKRESLQEGILALYSSAPKSWWDKLRLLLRLKFGNWKMDQAIREWQCKKLDVYCDEDSLILSLDGETQSFQTPLHFGVKQKSCALLIPQVSQS